MYKLLIVDDEVRILEGMKMLVDWRRYGFTEIATASNYRDAETLALTMMPDLCIFDVCIGADKGYDLIRRLRQLGLESSFIMISGYEEFQYAVEAFRSGTEDYLVKPVDKEKLVSIVERIIVEKLGGILPTREIKPDDLDPIVNLPYKNFSPLIARVIKMVHADYSQKMTLKNVAQQFRINNIYLGQLFLNEVHMKFSEYLMLYRLTQAKQLVEHTDRNFSAIAETVGYANLNYFYIQFHSYFGITPGEMRSQAAESRKGRAEGESGDERQTN